MPFKLAISIQSDTRYLAFLRQMVSAAASITGEKSFPKKAKDSVSLALIEAVDNAIFHAHKKCVHKPINIVLCVDERYIQVDVGDEGEGLGPIQMTEPKALSTRGRGLFLIMSMMNKVESLREGKTHWMRMTYYL